MFWNFIEDNLSNDLLQCFVFFFFFNDTATTEIYTLSLHDALPICRFALVGARHPDQGRAVDPRPTDVHWRFVASDEARSEEHTSELQSLTNLVCRLLLEKKKTKYRYMFGLCVEYFVRSEGVLHIRP